MPLDLQVSPVYIYMSIILVSFTSKLLEQHRHLEYLMFRISNYILEKCEKGDILKRKYLK